MKIAVNAVFLAAVAASIMTATASDAKTSLRGESKDHSHRRNLVETCDKRDPCTYDYSNGGDNRNNFCVWNGSATGTLYVKCCTAGYYRSDRLFLEKDVPSEEASTQPAEDITIFHVETAVPPEVVEELPEIDESIDEVEVEKSKKGK